jgi:hypothetical protein
MNKNKNMNDNNKMLERVLLMMKYDSSKTLKENSEVVKHEFAEQLSEAIKIGGPKPAPLPKGNKVGTKAPPKNTKGNTGLTMPPGLNLSQAQLAQFGNWKARFKAKNGRPPNRVEIQKYSQRYLKDTSILSKISNNIKNNKGKWTIGLIAGAGLTAAGIYLYLKPKVSPCLLDSLSEAELASLGAAGTTGKISRTQVGNRLADLNGGLTFSLDDTTVTTGNGKYSGSYSCDGNNIKVSIAGADFIIGGGASKDKGTSGGGTSGGGGGGSYRQCPETFPIAMNCKNSTIARVQGCIGVKQDGAFGPLTSQALVAKGADGSSITQATIDKVCGGGAAEKEKDPSSALSDDFSGQKSTGDSESTGASEPQGDTNL